MTKEEYIGHLRALYLAANKSDWPEEKPDWMKGDECSEHCCLYDKIATHMGLKGNWLDT